MRLAFGRDLRTMRDREQLRMLGQTRKPLTDGSRHRTADASVDFIKDNRRCPALFRQRDFQREDEARQFAARCNFCQRCKWCAGICRNQKLDAVHARCGPAVFGKLLDRCLELRRIQL